MKQIALALCLCLAGCKASTTTPPAALAPGAVNSFDQTAYQTLMTVQATLNSLSSSITNDPKLAGLKAPLNQAIGDYDLALVAWQTYHAAATTANQAAVAAAVTKVQADATNLQKASN